MRDKIAEMDEQIKSHLQSIWFNEGGCKMIEQWDHWNCEEFIGMDPDFYRENDLDLIFLFAEEDRKPILITGRYIDHDYDPDIITVCIGETYHDFLTEKIQSEIFVQMHPK